VGGSGRSVVGGVRADVRTAERHGFRPRDPGGRGAARTRPASFPGSRGGAAASGGGARPDGVTANGNGARATRCVAWSARGAGGRSESEGGSNGERRGLRPRRPGGRGAARTRPGLVVDSRRVGLLLLRRTATAFPPGRRAAWRRVTAPLGARGWSLGVGGGGERRTARASAAPARGPWRRPDETGVGGGFSSGRPASAAAHGYGELHCHRPPYEFPPGSPKATALGSAKVTAPGSAKVTARI
jgi:hypothetical protein